MYPFMNAFSKVQFLHDCPKIASSMVEGVFLVHTNHCNGKLFLKYILRRVKAQVSGNSYLGSIGQLCCMFGLG